MSMTRSTLDRARFFLAQAEAAELVALASSDRMPFRANIEAAIIYGRSVTFHLQKEFSNQKDFESWYGKVQVRLSENSRFRHLKDQRNIILKQGPLQIHRVVDLTGHTTIFTEISANMVLIRRQPWYRRSARILYEDIRSSLLQPFRRWAQQRERKRKRLAAQQRQAEQAAASVSVQKFVFDDPDLDGIPVQGIVGEWLDELDTIVSDAEIRFMS